MRITIPVFIEMNAEDIAEGARSCEMSEEDYRKKLEFTKPERLKHFLQYSEFTIDEKNIEVEK